jgi:acyl-CoA thioesterase FadM
VRVITEYKHELRLGDSVRLLSSLPRVDDSSVMPRHEMRKVPENTLSATWQSVTVRFDLTGRVSAPMPERLRTLAQ